MYNKGAGLVAIDLPLDKLDCRLFHPILLLLMTNPLHEHHDAGRKNYAAWRELTPFIFKAVSEQQSRKQDPDVPPQFRPDLGFFGELFSSQTTELFSSTAATIQQDPNTALPTSPDYRLFSYTALQFLYWSITNIAYVKWLPKTDVELELEGLAALDGVPVTARIFARGTRQTLVWEYVAHNCFPLIIACFEQHKLIRLQTPQSVNAPLSYVCASLGPYLPSPLQSTFANLVLSSSLPGLRALACQCAVAFCSI